MKLTFDGNQIQTTPGTSLLQLVHQLGLNGTSLADCPLAAKIAGEVFNLNYIPLREKDTLPDRPSIRRAMAASGVLSKTFLKHKTSTFLMEMPPLRRPRIGQILIRSLLDRTLHIAGRALIVAAPAGALLWWLSDTQLLVEVAQWLEPVGCFLGMNGVILLAFLFSLPANELLLPVIFMVLTGAGSLQGIEEGTGQLFLAAGWTWMTAVCTMVFSVFHWPCATTLLTIHKETGSLKKTAAAFLLPTVIGVIICILLHGIFTGILLIFPQ